MKKKFIIPVLLIMFGCAEIKNAPDGNTTSSKGEIEKKIKTIEGEVLEINQGKDGYTAKLKTNTEEIYFVTISHSNLKNPTQYKATKIGEKLKVSGELWKMNGENQITVREIL
jgi:vacuolar-type H+-ATPase subunit I/STV1